MSKRIARRLVRLYPRAWRARYEDEFVALLDARGDLTLSPTLLDVARAPPAANGDGQSLVWRSRSQPICPG